MAYDTSVSTPGLIAQKNGSNGNAIWIYKSADGMALVGAADYFSNGYDLGMKVGDQIIVVNTTTSGVTVGSVVEVTTDGAASISGGTLELTATAAVDAGIRIVELNHATVVIAATIADASLHQGLFIVINTSASGTAAHTLTLTSGNFNGSNNVATLNAPAEALAVLFDDAGNGTVIANTGSVALS